MGGGLGSGSKQGQEVGELSDPGNLGAQPLPTDYVPVRRLVNHGGRRAGQQLLASCSRTIQEPQTSGRLLASSAEQFALTERRGRVRLCMSSCCSCTDAAGLFGCFFRPSL